MNNTIYYYNNNAQKYFIETIGGDMQLSYDKFLVHIPQGGYILDFGCGSGRDSFYFIKKGYKVKAIDGSIELCNLASQYINQKVQCICFENFKEQNVYDGIWACASILHIEEKDFLIVYKNIIDALKPGGVIYISFKNGKGEELKNGRYFKYYTKEEFIKHTKQFSDLEILDIYTSKSTTNINEDRYWNNFILKKVKKI